MPPEDGRQEDPDRLDLESVVIERFQTQLGIDDLAPDSDLLTDLGLDSIGLVTILLDLADEFGLDLSSSTLAGIETVRDVVGMVDELFARARASG